MGNALAWFDSYLKSRKQFVQIEDCQSAQRCLAHGVPQGSELRVKDISAIGDVNVWSQ